MNKGLVDIVTYDGKRLNDLKEESGKKKIDIIVKILQPLHSEIKRDNLGSIDIQKSGNIVCAGFDANLEKQIIRHLRRALMSTDWPIDLN